MLGSFCVHTLLSSLSLSFSQEHPMSCHSWSLHNITNFLLAPQWCQVQSASKSMACSKAATSVLWMTPALADPPERSCLKTDKRTLFGLFRISAPSWYYFYIYLYFWLVEVTAKFLTVLWVHENSGLFIWNASDSSGKPRII